MFICRGNNEIIPGTPESCAGDKIALIDTAGNASVAV